MRSARRPGGAGDPGPTRARHLRWLSLHRHGAWRSQAIDRTRCHKPGSTGVFPVRGGRGEGRLDGVLEDEAASRRDDELFADLYPSLRRFAAVVRPPEADADDLVQEALVRALRIGPLSRVRRPRRVLAEVDREARVEP